MKHKPRLVLSAILSGLFGAAIPAFPQEEEPLQPLQAPSALLAEEPDPAPAQPAAEAPADPTRADPALMSYLAAAPGKAAARFPAVALRGKLIARDGASVVILEIDGRFHLLKQGASVSPGGEYGQITLHLKEVEKDKVVVEAQPLNQTLVLQ